MQKGRKGSLLSAIIVLLSLAVKNDYQEITEAGFASLLHNISELFNVDLLLHSILFTALFFLFEKTGKTEDKSTKRMKRTAFVFALFFSGMTVVGAAYESFGTLSLFGGTAARIKTVIKLVGFAVLFRRLLLIVCITDWNALIWNRTDCPVQCKRTGIIHKYTVALIEHPVQICVVTLLIAYLPWIVMNYPALLSGDAAYQMADGFNVNAFSPYNRIIYEGSRLSNHHPVMHTLLLTACVNLGKRLFSSWNAGLMLYVIVQTAFLILTISLSTALLIKSGVKERIAVLYVLYFALHPRLCNFVNLVTKDVIYSGFLLLWLTCVYSWKSVPSRLCLSGVLVSTAGVILFRNEGKYILFGFCLIELLMNKQTRKEVLLYLSGIFCFVAVWNHAVLPALRVSPGSIREALSVPLQQTARYVKLFPEDVSQEEEKTINAVVDYEHLAERYTPTLADSVKSSFRQSCTRKEVMQYLFCWGKMFKKHPGVYLDAFMEWKYNYFYPTPRLTSNLYSYQNTSGEIERANRFLKPLDAAFRQPAAFAAPARALETVREGIWRLPLLNIFLSAALYLWIPLTIFGCLLAKRKKVTIAVIPLFQEIINLLGPTSGSYFRYLFPICMVLPFILLVSTLKSNEQRENRRI
ncbi:MAG: hypothetical protein IJ573_03300 [Clostridia bacterium]|nr:hypothetical protein [Clostridia bacterium]